MAKYSIMWPSSLGKTMDRKDLAVRGLVKTLQVVKPLRFSNFSGAFGFGNDTALH